jgi:S-(hydroxymethyl)glutathione synthase
MTDVTLHPMIDSGLVPGLEGFTGGVLTCLCAQDPVKVEIASQIAHNHACGCTKCWKPEGAIFSVVAVVPTTAVTVLEHGEKLDVVDPSATILRHACTVCGLHLHGPVEDTAHPFFGLSFIHPERFEQPGSAAAGFAAFVSSVIEAGTPPEAMDAIRERLTDLGLPPYDCLNPPLMDSSRPTSQGALASWPDR